MAQRRKCECGTCPRCKHREYMRGWYWRNRDKACETARATRERHADKIREYDRERGRRYGEPEKERARRSVKWAIDSGALTREPCEVCGSIVVDGHHDDYSKPLVVRWLCKRHHGEVHRRALLEAV